LSVLENIERREEETYWLVNVKCETRLDTAETGGRELGGGVADVRTGRTWRGRTKSGGTSDRWFGYLSKF